METHKLEQKKIQLINIQTYVEARLTEKTANQRNRGIQRERKVKMVMIKHG